MEFDSLLTAAEVAEILRMTPGHVRNLCNAGEITFVKLGPRTIRIPESGLRRFLERKSSESAQEDRSDDVLKPAPDQETAS